MEFNQIQKVLAALQKQCPYTDAREIEVWTAAISVVRGTLAQMAATENDARIREDDDGAIH